MRESRVSVIDLVKGLREVFNAFAELLNGYPVECGDDLLHLLGGQVEEVLDQIAVNESPRWLDLAI